MTHILIIDTSKNLEEQFQEYAKITGYSAVSLALAYQQYVKETAVTSTFKNSEFLFEKLVPEEKEVFVEKKQSYQQWQRSLPKFLKKKIK